MEFRNAKSHRFCIHPLDEHLVRIVHILPSRVNAVKLRGIQFEDRDQTHWLVSTEEKAKRVTLQSPRAFLSIVVDYNLYIRLTWNWGQTSVTGDPHVHTDPIEFLKSFKFAYPYDEVSGHVWH